MRICSFCGDGCDSQIGYYEEVKHVHWGGYRNGNVDYQEKKVFFFCSEEHRGAFMIYGPTAVAGINFETQTDRWQNTGEE